MIVFFKKTAIDDINAACAYIGEVLKNKSAARKLASSIYDTAMLLSDNPYMGAPLNGKYSVDTDLRFLVVSKQLIFYRVLEDDHIEVTRVLDGRQDYMTILF